MSKIIYVKNISGSNLLVNDLKNKRISHDPTKKIGFSSEDFEHSESLKELIRSKMLVIVDENEEEPEDVTPVEKSSDDIVSFGDSGIQKTQDFKTEKKQEEKYSKLKEIWWCGPANDAGGYGKMSRECLERLFLRKDLKVHHEPFGLGDARARLKPSQALEKMQENKVSEDATGVWAIMPPKFFTRNGKKILYTMIESKGVPPQFLKKCNNADELWVPSQSNMDAFQEAGLKIPICKMPLGVDTNRFKSFKINQEHFEKIRNIKTKTFVFTSLFGWSLRKGVDILFRSYLEEFTQDDDVTLMVVSRNWGNSSSENNDKIRTDIKNYINKYAKNPERPPHIVHVGQPLPEEDLPIIYNMSNVFVLLSRGEGFSLTPMEAGSCEIPVIATRIGGHEDYLTDENSYLIDIEGYDSNSQEVKEISKISSYYENMPFCILGTKAVNQTKEKMRFIMNNYSEAKEKARILRKDIVDNFTWDHMEERIYNRLIG